MRECVALYRDMEQSRDCPGASGLVLEHFGEMTLPGDGERHCPFFSLSSAPRPPQEKGKQSQSVCIPGFPQQEKRKIRCYGDLLGHG